MLQNRFMKIMGLSTIVFLFCSFIADVSLAKTKVVRTGRVVDRNTKKLTEPVPNISIINVQQDKYQPYLQFGGTRFIRVKDSLSALNVDVFVPVWQQNLADLVFVDFRFKDFTGTPYEGNMHVGYRHLFSDGNMLWGAYLGFDRRKTGAHNYFNQVMLGGEYWYKRFFVGGNIYNPISSRVKDTNLEFPYSVDYIEKGIYTDIIGLGDQSREKVLAGIDAEVGYEIMDGLVGYLGGYYFKGSEADAVSGPRARLTYEFGLGSDKRILEVFDNFNLEVGIQRDNTRGTVWYLSAKGKIGWLFDKKTMLQGVSRHMVDQVHRDVDVIATTKAKKVHEKLDRSIIVDDVDKFVAAINDESVTMIDVRFAKAWGMRKHEITALKFYRRKPLIVIFDGYINKKILYDIGTGAGTRKWDRLFANMVVEGKVGVVSMPKFVEVLKSRSDTFTIHLPDFGNKREYKANKWTKYADDLARLLERQDAITLQREQHDFFEDDPAESPY